MKISPTDLEADPAAGGTLLRFAGGGGRWLLLDDAGIAVRGGADEVLAVSPGMRTALAVPGTEVAIHWLELEEELDPGAGGRGGAAAARRRQRGAARRHACRGRAARSAG